MGSPLWFHYFVFIACFIVIVFGETEWVWSKNRTPHQSSSSSGGNNNQNNFQSTNNFGGGSSIPQSPSRPTIFQTSQNNNNANNNGNNALPANTIRVVNSQGEARLIPGALNFVSNALQGGGGGGGGGGGNGGTGLISIGGGLLSSILSNGPQIGSSVLNFLLGRSPSVNNNNGNNNNIGTLPASSGLPSFPSNNNNNNNNNGGSGNAVFPGGISSSAGSDCRCISENLCFLPNRPNGQCGTGNIQCCGGGTRSIFPDDNINSNNNNGNPTRQVKTPLDVRVGLIENIVRGSSTIFDDALDLVLQPYLTEEDKQKLATRIANG